MFKIILGAAGTLAAVIGLGAAYKEGYKDGIKKCDNMIATFIKAAETVKKTEEESK